MDIRMIAMDLDGTALCKDRCSFSPRLKAALDAAFQKGVAIIPITGRQYDLLPPAVAEHPNWSSFVVVCNGGQIRHLKSGELIHGLSIPSQSLFQLYALAEELDIPLEFSLNGKLHLTQKSYDQQYPQEQLTFHVHTVLPQCGVIVDSLLPMCEMDGIEKAQLPSIPPEFKQLVDDRLRKIDVSAVWSSSSSMEITHSDATKGNALEQLSNLLDIPMDQIMALGDSGNDIPMLHRAGLGVAMGNAPDDVKKIADVITESNVNDGAAIAIERYVLHI